MKQGINIETLLSDYGIEWSDSRSKNVASGWIGINCPFCPASDPDPSDHGAFSKDGQIFSCWRCGKHNPIEALKRLTKVKNISAIIKNYPASKLARRILPEEPKIKKICVLKPEFKPLNKRHKHYLIIRKFDPDKLVSEWGLLGTGPIGSYSHRIIAPIYRQGELISYQGRDYTGMTRLRYKTCSKQDEAYPHKNTLYGIDKVKGETVIVVEGIFDVWRLGPGAVATFGIGFTKGQIRELIRFNRIFIVFDPEPQAQERAEALGNELSVIGKQVEIIKLKDKDPAELNETEINNLKRLVF